MSSPITSDRVSETTAIDESTTPPRRDDPYLVNGASGSKPNGKLPGAGVVQDEKKKRKGDRDDGKHELQQQEVMDELPYSWSPRKKWTILTVIFVVQCSMNCTSDLDHMGTKLGRERPADLDLSVNASIYANGVDFLTEKFSISAQAARVGQMIFLICYAFGCELWAPWSEELGRRWTLQASLFLVNSGSASVCPVHLS